VDEAAAMQFLGRAGLDLGESTWGEADSCGLKSFSQRFSIVDDNVALYGLGQFDDGAVNWRGKSRLIAQSYIGSPCPLLVSTGGWAILWPALCESHFDDGPDGLVFRAESVRSLEFYVLLGDTIDDQIARYRQLTGQAPLMPRYFYGFWQFYNRYKTFEEIHAVIDEYRKRKLPLDAIVQDWKYWQDEADEHWNSLELEPSRYPDPVANIAAVHDRNVKFMMTLWPAFGTATDNWRRMKESGFLLDDIHLCDGAAEIYDAFNPDARDAYWQMVKEKMLGIGVDALWMDGTEPDCGASGAGADAPYHEKFATCGGTAAGPVREVLNAFPLATTDGVYRHWRSERDDRCCILTRASYAGTQRNGAAVWSGDTHCRWEDLKRQIPMGINLSMAGIPYWSHDIGGWLWEEDLYPGGAADPAFAELHTRWFQLGVFTPMCRIHGSWTPREIYRFREPFYAAHVKFLELRSRLLPYIYSLAWRVTNEGYTIMRGLAMDFPGDPRVLGIDNQYMFGPAFLVRPVMEPMLRPAPEYGDDAEAARNPSGQVEVYLPAGIDWYDFWTNRRYSGGQMLLVDSAIDHLPLFVRAGSIVPLGPVKDYADQPSDAPLEIRVYPGADAEFTLYDDDGRTYDYEEGSRTTTPLRWSQSEQRLYPESMASTHVLIQGHSHNRS
jgi:alpha-D-xyloside xylohydrolase